MEGTWNFLYTPGQKTGSCDGAMFPAPPASVTFTRAGARIYATVSGQDLEGTIFEDNTFSMHGDTLATDGGTGQRIELRGDYRGPLTSDAGSSSDGGSADGGTASADGNPRLTGTYTQVNGLTGDSCRNPSTFSAFK
jgi:hypothetical protein